MTDPAAVQPGNPHARLLAADPTHQLTRCHFQRSGTRHERCTASHVERCHKLGHNGWATKESQNGIETQ